MDGWPTGEGADHDLRPPLSPRAPISHKRFLVELNPEERTYLKQLVAAGSPKRCPDAGPRSGCSATRGRRDRSGPTNARRKPWPWPP